MLNDTFHVATCEVNSSTHVAQPGNVPHELSSPGTVNRAPAGATPPLGSGAPGVVRTNPGVRLTARQSLSNTSPAPTGVSSPAHAGIHAPKVQPPTLLDDGNLHTLDVGTVHGNTTLYHTSQTGVGNDHLRGAPNAAPTTTTDHLGDDLFAPKLSPQVIEQYARQVSNIWPDPTPLAHEQFPAFCELYNHVKSYRLPNAAGAKVTLKSGLNLSKWEEYLRDYHDREVCAYLRYGWPVGYLGDQPPASVKNNHPSGYVYKSHVKKFISTELGHDAIIGPFKEQPFEPWTRISPIMSRPKKDSDSRRIIIDLTYPEGHGVNKGIDITSVLGRDISYTLPNIWDLTASLQNIGALMIISVT